MQQVDLKNLWRSEEKNEKNLKKNCGKTFRKTVEKPLKSVENFGKHFKNCGDTERDNELKKNCRTLVETLRE